MRTIERVAEMRAASSAWRKIGKTVGFIPTMGALHEGHLSLVRESRRRADITVVSIFVNPAQFGPQEDLARYPRDLARDSTLLEKEGVDALFHPDETEMYPPGYRTTIDVQGLQERLCGASRPGHFRGVATVVLKLFNIVRPDVAFFGWKDAQQLILLRRMIRDLDGDVKIVGLPIVRELDGLAMSSRNAYLSPEERKAAAVLSKSLTKAEQAIRAGERDARKIAAIVRSAIAAEPQARLDYVEVVDERSLDPLAAIAGDVLVALAVFVGRTRLIDNVRIHV
ncbi:MAG: pantoate--beta-alanine ligase [Candidatus Aminicenantes bacterium]|nr:pantoate--beta-alanine ligase [Candidatus Aminicenantes bacterium]